MRVVAMKVYRQNRARFPANELKPYIGQWVAFSSDGQRVVASGNSIAQLSERVGAADVDIQDVVLERINAEGEDLQLGGAELH